MKDKVFGILQRVGRAFMLPIALLPVAGLLLGIGSSLTNMTILETYGLLGILGPGTIPYAIFTVMKDAGDIVFDNLPLLFAIGVAIGMAKKEKEVAALSATISFFIMHASISALIELHGGANAMLDGATVSVCGISSLQMGAFGGMIVGLGVAALHNKFYRIELPQVISFFGGTRFVPIISALVYTFVGILMYFVWPPIQQGIYDIGSIVSKSGYVETWVYGFMERILIPFGLHHVFYLPFWQTGLGGTMEIQGVLVEGAQNIFFAQLSDPNVTQYAVTATRFMAGKFPLMIFGLPGAALAIYKMAKPEKRKEVGGLLISAALTSMLTGVTEPIEFTFLFVAPLLYGIHCVFAGLSFMLMHICNVGVGLTFSGGFIDLLLFGILQGNSKTNWVWVIIIGVGYFITYYFLFCYLIRKMDIKTPGRDDTKKVKLYTSEDVEMRRRFRNEDFSEQICKGLGGKANISDIDCCATRIRCTVRKAVLVNDELLKATGASGVIHKGNGVQIVYGPQVTVIYTKLQDYMEHMTQQEDMKAIVISSPVDGVAADISTTPDEVFAKHIMGDGVTIMPTDGMVYAPEDGQVCFVFETKHAVGFVTDSGVSLLLHMGIDTVELKGVGFETFVQAGQFVKKGEPLLKMDLAYIGEHATSVASPIVCTELENNQKVQLLTEGPVKAGDPLFVIHRN